MLQKLPPLLVKRRGITLLVVAAALTGIEALVLQGISFESALPLAPQVSAPAPFAVFHDLRWVWTFAYSPWSTVWMLVVLFAFRTTAGALLTVLAWPGGLTPPRFPVLLRRSAAFTALAVVAMSAWASVSFLGGVTGLSELVLGAIIGSGLTALILPPGIITGQWWRKILPLRSMGWMLVSWLELTVAALAITFSPPWVTVLVAVGGGLVNGWLWQRIVATVVRAGEPRWTIPAVPVAALLVTAGLLVIGGFAFSATIAGKKGSSSAQGGRTAASGPPVIFVGGFDSHYDGGPVHVLPDGFDAVNYSYRGLGDNGRPLPYTYQDTHQSLAVSARRLADQVQALHQRTGQPVSLVSQSEGTMVAVTYLQTAAYPPVNAMVELSPLIRPGRVFYPLAGHDGFGYIAGWESRGIMSLFRMEASSNDLRADMPFLRSLVDRAPAYRDHTLCLFPGVRTYLLLPLEGALTVYRGPISRIGWTAFPGFHASLLDGPETQQIVANVLTGKQESHQGWKVAFELIHGAAGAWQSPALPLHARSSWNAAPNSDPAFGNWHCPSTGSS